MATQTAEKKPDTVSTNILETLSNIRKGDLLFDLSHNILETLSNIQKGDLLFDLSQKTEELVKAIRRNLAALKEEYTDGIWEA